MKSFYYESDLGVVHYLDSCSSTQKSIVFLHGFTGSSRDFLEIPDSIISNYRCLIPDLPGHGQTQVLENENSFTASAQVHLLAQWLSFLGQSRVNLFGYSMGGRLALQFAVKNFRQLDSLILVSTTAGIKEPVARSVRAEADLKLAEQILNSNPGDFLTTWLAQPLFKGVTDQGQDFVNQEVLRRLPLQASGLACSLRYFSSGVVPAVWHQLKDIESPTLVIAGVQDQKYLSLASKLLSLIPNSKLTVLPTSHAPLIEFPSLLWEQVADFLNTH